MDIIFACQNCRQQLEADSSMAGQAIECPACNAKLVIQSVERLRNMSPLYEMHKEGVDLKSIQWEAH